MTNQTACFISFLAGIVVVICSLFLMRNATLSSGSAIDWKANAAEWERLAKGFQVETARWEKIANGYRVEAEKCLDSKQGLH